MDNILLDIGGKEFYFDIDSLSREVQIKESAIINDENSGETECKKDIKVDPYIQIDVAKYEMYRDLINTLLSTNDLIDDKMGMMALNSLSIPFKLSFNTLLIKGIIKEL